jgi:hypothetical protein
LDWGWVGCTGQECISGRVESCRMCFGLPAGGCEDRRTSLEGNIVVAVCWGLVGEEETWGLLVVAAAVVGRLESVFVVVAEGTAPERWGLACTKESARTGSAAAVQMGFACTGSVCLDLACIGSA